jgi:hypothetical protein
MQPSDQLTDENAVQLDKLHLAGLIAALVGAALFAYLGLTAYGMGGVGIGFTLICLVGAFYAFIGLRKAPCPGCGYMTGGLASGSVQCKGCGDYFKIEDGRTVLTGSDAIEDFPAFSTPCPRDIDWPAGCCVCRGEVTGTAPVRLELKEDSPVAADMLTRAATLGTFKLVSKRIFEVQVPVCDQHESDSAELNYRYDEEQLHILFRSRSYAEAFADAQGQVFWGD